MKTLFFLLLILCDVSSLYAQSVRYPLAQPYAGLSAYSLVQHDPLSFTGNQAALAQLRQAGLGIYGERRFMLKENSSYTMGIAVPSRLGNAGLVLQYAGFAHFNESRVGLAYARRLGALLDLGIQFTYYGYRVPVYGGASTVTVEAGILLHPIDKWNLGVHVYNPVGGRLGKSTSPLLKHEKLASAYKIGLGYDASEQFFISAEIVKEEDKPVNAIAGFQYRFTQQFFLRAGFVSETTLLYAGAGISWKLFRLDISVSYHPQLGFSPGILLIAQRKKKQA